MWLIPIFMFVGLILWFVHDKWRYAKCPPGPIRIPLLGNLLQLMRLSPYPFVAFQELAKVYGDMVYVRIGLNNTSEAIMIVTFNSFETVRDILNHECTADRSQNMVPVIWERMRRKNLGVAFSNGKEWQTLRRFTIRTLRDFGFGKEASMDVVINEELEKFTAYLKHLSLENPDGIPEAQRLFDLSIINILWRLVTGQNYELSDAKLLRLLQLNHDVFQSASFAMDITIAFPPLYNLLPSLMGKTYQMDTLEGLCKFIRETIDHHRGQGDYQTSPQSYVDVFLSKIDEYKDGPTNTEFTDEQLVLCLLDLFQAGSDTTSNTLGFSMQYMILYPEIQEKVQSEIDRNVSKSESIMLSTRNRLPYTHATLLECMRYSTVVPTPAARKATRDFYFNGYFIPKGMSLISNLYAAHFSEDIWGDPYNFRPERFLNSDGEVDGKLSGYLLPFGNGPRKCLAGSLAETSLFLYFVTILRHFKVLNGREGKEIDRLPTFGITLVPKPYTAKFVPKR